MRLVCAWCGITIERPGYNQELEVKTSHGMCPDCAVAFSSQERGTSLEHHLDTIPIPVLLVDANTIVVTMNARARETLRREVDDEEAGSFGEVFDCVHSRSPEGCGRAIHCSGCAIRRCVTATFNSGEPQVLVPATLMVTNADQLSEVAFAITTVKRGEFVLLRVE